MRNAYEVRRLAELIESSRRTVKTATCSKCGAACLRGDDHDTMAMVATVDITPIDHLSEALARLDGLFTYDIAPQKGKTAKRGAFVLHYREAWHYEFEKRKYPVLVDHACERGVI